MKLNKLFLESDARIRQMAQELQQDPNNEELFQNFVNILKRMGVDEDDLPLDNTAYLKCADYLAKKILENVKGQSNFQQINWIINRIIESNGVFVDMDWNKEINELPNITQEQRNLISNLILLGDLVRSAKGEISEAAKRNYFDMFWFNLDLNFNDLVRIVYL